MYGLRALEGCTQGVCFCGLFSDTAATVAAGKYSCRILVSKMGAELRQMVTQLVDGTQKSTVMLQCK